MKSARVNHTLGITVFIVIVAGAVLTALFVNVIGTAQKSRAVVQISPPVQQVTTPPEVTQNPTTQSADQPIESATRAKADMRIPGPKQADTSSPGPEVPAPDLITVGTYAFTNSTGVALEDMSSGTTQIVAASQDDLNSAVTNIGFDFWYDGVRASQFSANANGLIRLGSTQVSQGFSNGLGTTTDAPKIGAYWDDISTGTNGKVHYKVIGSAPNRKLIVEFQNMNVPRAGGAGTFVPAAGAATFQAWLFETTGVIEFVYGSGIALNSVNSGYSVGLQSGALTNFASVTTTGSTVSYAAANDTQSNAITSGTAYLFTPNTPAAPTGFSATAVTQTSMTLNWSDIATNEFGYAVYQSNDGGTTYNFVTQTAANATSQAISGLNPSTNYFFKIFAVTEGAVSSALTGSQLTPAPGVVTSNFVGGPWSSPGTWAGGVVPTSGDNVTIADGATVTIDTAAVALNVTVGQGASGVLQWDTASARTLVVGQSVTITTGGTFKTGAALAVNTHVLTVGTDLTNNGTLDFSTTGSAANSCQAGITFTGSNNNTFGGTGGTTDIKTITVNKGTSNANTLELNPTNFTVQGTTTDGTPMAFLTLTNGTFKVSGTFTLTGRVFTTAGYTIGATTGFWLNNPNFTVAGQNGSPTEAGLLRISTGTFNIGTATGNSMGFSSGSTITVEGGAVNATGRFGVSAAANTVTYTQSAGTITVCTIGNGSATLGSFDLGTSASSVVNISGGTIVAQLLASGIDYRYDAGSGIAGLTGGTLQLGNASSGAAKLFNIRGDVPNLVIDTTSAGHTATFSNTLVNYFNASLNITIGAGGTLNLNGNATSTLFFMEGSTLTNNGTLTATQANKRMYWAGSTAQTFAGSGVVTAAMNSLELDNVNGLTLTTTNQIPTLRFILFSGSVTGAGKLTMGNGGVTAGTFQIGNTVDPSAAGTFDASPTFNLGSGGEVISYLRCTTNRNTGPEIQPSRSITTLNIDPNGINVSLAGGDLAVTGVTTITTGNFIIGANKLTVTNAIAGALPTGLLGGATSSLQLDGTVASNVPSSITQLNNFTLNNAGGSTMQGQLAIGGTLTLTNGALSIAANELTINGPLTVGTGTLTGGATSNIFVGGNGASLTLPAVSGGLGRLSVNRASGVTLGAPLGLSVALELFSGTLSNTTNNVTLANNAIISVGTGSLTSAPIFGASVNLVYLGSLPATTGLEVPVSSTVLNNLTVDNPGGVTLASSPIVNGQLSLTNGVVTTGANVLIVGASGTTTRTNGYVNGNEARTFSGAGTLTYDIGAGGSYTPVSVNALALTLPQAILTVKAVNSSIGGLVSLQSLQRNWVFSSSPIARATLTFNYVNGDVPGGANTAQWRVVRKLSGDQRFTFPNGFIDNVSEGGNTATASNITMPAFGGTYTITQTNAPAVRVGDPRPVETFDFKGNDSRTDVSIWDGTSGVWKFINSSNDVQTSSNPWGSTALGDHIVPGDYDGDGITDLAVWRDTDFNWFIFKSSNGLAQAINWGGFGDKVVPGDYDGDGKTDVAVFRPSEGNWYIVKSSNNTVVVRNWGAAGDYLVPSDYDGDGKTDIAVYRPSEGNWYVVKSSDNSVVVRSWGTTGDSVVPGDYDGDGKTDFAIFRPSEGNWYVINSADSSVTVRNWGTSGDTLVPGDYDRDGRIDFAVFRPSEGNWYIVNSGDGTLTLRNLVGGTIVPAAYVQP